MHMVPEDRNPYRILIFSISSLTFMSAFVQLSASDRGHSSEVHTYIERLTLWRVGRL